MEAGEVLESLRILLVSGLALSAVLAFVVLRGESDAAWHRRYLDEHPGLQHDYETWRRRRRRELALAKGRCPDHDLVLDPRGACTRCRGRPAS